MTIYATIGALDCGASLRQQDAIFEIANPRMASSIRLLFLLWDHVLGCLEPWGGGLKMHPDVLSLLLQSLRIQKSRIYIV